MVTCSYFNEYKSKYAFLSLINIFSTICYFLKRETKTPDLHLRLIYVDKVREYKSRARKH